MKWVLLNNIIISSTICTCDRTNEQILQPDVVGICLKEISCEDKAWLGAHGAALHLHTRNQSWSQNS